MIGVGASAGGLDPIIGFLKEVPGNCDSAFLVAQHLSPDHDSAMKELLAPHVKLPVVEAVDGMRLEGGSIYLCPPGVIPRVKQMVLELEKRPKNKSVVLPIDILFESMGKTLGSSCATVVLSGTGSDGSRGIHSVEQNGGIVAVQSPATAAFTGMPQSAISTGKNHIIASPEELWIEIKSCADEKNSNPAAEESQLSDNIEEPSLESEDCAEIFAYLEGRFGLNFSLYRINSVARRLKRRMDILAIPDIETYLVYLEKHHSEAQCLYKDFLIGVTEFFRDEESFATLSREAIKSAMTVERDQDFRIWSAGCATGQEAYSLYMLADEVRQEVGFTGRVTVFATDVFEPSISFAGKGIYKAEELKGLSADRKDRYFEEFDSGRYKIQSHVRENIVFAQHNFLNDAPFTNIDIGCCRNVLIYMNPDTQAVALSAFAFSLHDRGFLFLGSSESLGQFERSFKTVSGKARIFQKYSSELDPKRWPKDLAQVQKTKQAHAPNMSASVTINRDLLSAYDSILDQYAPCGFLVNADREVLHYFGDSADYCINVSGRARQGLTEQLDERLQAPVTSLMHLAERKKQRVISKELHCESRNGECLVDVSVKPLLGQHSEACNYLVQIHSREAHDAADASDHTGISLELTEAVHADDQVKMLEDELKSTRENLETANEELQVSNEELQSTNEELTTLNSEYDRKNVELAEINTSHENLLESTEDGVLYVDKELRIRRFNTAVKTAFSLAPKDVGRPIQDIAYHMGGDISILDDVRSVLDTGRRVERETGLINERFYMIRIAPYRYAEGTIGGVLLSFTDVTEVRHLEKRFRFALQTAKLSWWDWDLVDDKLEVTSGGSCLLGEHCLDVGRGRDGWMELVHPDDREHVGRTLDDCIKGHTAEWDCEHRFRTDSGEWLWVHNQGLVTKRDEKGSPVEMMGTTRDVNSYKCALIEAQNQQVALTAADEVSKVGTWDYDPETEEMTWSKEIRRILEVDEDFEPSAENTYKLMHAEDRKLLDNAFEQIKADGTPYDLQLRFISAKGKDLLCRSAGRANYSEKGRIIRVVGVFQDITEQTLVQQELEAFFKLSPDFQATLGMDGSFRFWSPSWKKELDYLEDELSSMHVSDLVADVDRADFSEILDQAIAGTPVRNYETRVIPNTTVRSACNTKLPWISWSFWNEPKLSLLFVSARCVTAEKEAQQALQEARIRAEEASLAKTDFLAVMSHELRTPLNPILGFTEMMLEDAETEGEKETLNTIIESGEHMLTLIDEILEYGKLNAGKKEVEPIEFSLEDMVSNKLHLMKGQIKDEPIDLSSSINWGSIDEARAPKLIGDVGMIRQIARNLISNAIKFTQEGEVDFHVSVQKVEGERVIVQFDVSDSGIGISEENRAKLFSPFTQVQGGTTREYGGTGLGLAICKRLVDLMDGSISLESKEGEGSTFSFTLPLGLRYMDSAPSAKEQMSTPADEQKSKLAGSVLLVEDNEANALYIKKLIDIRKANVETAVRGEHALELLEERSFGLILLDLHMPGIGGLETLKRIRSSDSAEVKKVPAIILTGDASVEAKKDCKKHGADGLLTKPIRPKEMDELLDKYLIGRAS